MTTPTALRVHANIMHLEEMDKIDIEGWADTATKLMEATAFEMERLQARDVANVETIKHLAAMLARS